MANKSQIIPRQSNMELLRIVATLLILVLHADFFSIGEPSAADFAVEPIDSVSRVFIEFMSIVGVNVFILISAWFGIKLTTRGICKLLFQCAFFSSLTYFGAYYAGWVDFHGSSVLAALTACSNWFVVAYIGLMILSPALNAYVKVASKHQLEATILLFFSFQTFYGYFTTFRSPVAGGYSTISFIGLYLLGRYVSTYKSNICKWGGRCFAVYIICVILNTLLYILFKRIDYSYILLAYINPLNIIGACALTFSFTGLRMRYNRRINYIAASVFAAFLLHASQYELYQDLMQYLYTAYPGFGYILAAGGAIIAIFIVAVLLDKIRIYLWNRLILCRQSVKVGPILNI